MPDPSAYFVGYSFTGFQATAPATPLPAARVDAELIGIEASIATLVSSVKDVRRADGALKNGIVTLESLSAGLISGLADLDEDQAAALDAAVAAVQDGVDEQIAELGATKADLVHTHAATEISIAAISGLVGATVQAALAELKALGPQTGDLLLTMVATTRAGWVACNDGTIGNLGSGATTRANADTFSLYELLWTNVPDELAPVTGGRSDTALIDFNLLRPIGLTKMLGRALAIAGTGSGLSARTLGQIVGVENQALSVANLPAHAHGGSTSTVAAVTMTADVTFDSGAFTAGAAGGLSQVNAGDNDANVSSVPAHSHAITSQGEGVAANNMQPTAFVKAYLKL